MAAKVEKQRMVDVCPDKFLNSAPNAAPNTNQSEHQPPLSFDSFISFHLTSKLACVYVCVCVVAVLQTVLAGVVRLVYKVAREGRRNTTSCATNTSGAQWLQLRAHQPTTHPFTASRFHYCSTHHSGSSSSSSYRTSRLWLVYARD